MIVRFPVLLWCFMSAWPISGFSRRALRLSSPMRRRSNTYRSNRFSRASVQSPKVGMIPPIQKNCDTRRPSLSSSSMPLWCRSIQDWMAVSTLMVVLVLFGGTVAPPAASAFSASTASSVTVFQNEYQDPQFPKCRRTITVDGTQLEYTGTAIDHGTKDCTPQNIRQYRIEVIKNQGGIVLSEDNDETATIELGALKGVWEPAVVSSSSSDDSLQNVDGIRWSDGNKWVVKRKPMSTTIGEGIFYAYIGLSTLAGVKGVWDGIQRKRQEEKQSS